ncbi:hypothetical protein F444_09873 [Phytophthora nicotianae P1976]|uniref:Uncharacterized protein n=1 Tax=Phytophthora nicotianae P1976 TaxID=1317066 RepID=A0A081A657_PHYNI|nr:hypothetical protein F444_09873 [Phytophthora nicotianae P1976]
MRTTYYVLDTRGFSTNGFQIHGSDLTIDVKYEKSTPRITAPRGASDVVASCGTVPFGKRITPSVSSLLARSVSEWGYRSLHTEETEFGFGDVIQKIILSARARFQKRLVSSLLHVSTTSNRITKHIKDTIIVTHSMANLMFAGAIASGLTTLDSSSTLVGTSGPLEGSMGSNYLY